MHLTLAFSPQRRPRTAFHDKSAAVCTAVPPRTDSISHHVSESNRLARGLRAACLAACATSLAQVLGACLDVLTRHISQNGYSSIVLSRHPGTLLQSVPLPSLLQGTWLHVAKRAPTKALAALLYESRGVHGRFAAAFSAAVALVITYPLHAAYYGLRKGVALSAIARVHPRSLYAGIAPAVAGVAPSIAGDFLVYKTVRKYCENHGFSQVHCVTVAAAMATVASGALAEPLKAVARKTAVDALNGGAKGVLGIATGMIKKGPAEFWRGFPARSVRYAATAVVSKIATAKLNAVANEKAPLSTQASRKES